MTPKEVADKAGTSPAYVHRVIQGKQHPSKRLIPYLNLLDDRSRELYFKQRDRDTWGEHIRILQDLDRISQAMLQLFKELGIEIAWPA